MKHRYLLIVFLWAFCSLLCLNSTASAPKVSNNADEASQQETYIRDLIDKSGDRIRWSHTARLDFAKAAYSYAVATGSESLRMDAMFCLAELNYQQGDFDTSLAYFDSLLVYASQTGNLALEVKSRNLVGNIYRYRGQFYEALDMTYQAFVVVENSSRRDLKALSANNLGVIYRNLHDTTLALDFYKLAQQNAVAVADTNQIIHALTNMGNLYWFKKEAAKAQEIYEQALDLAKATNDMQHIASLSNNIANTYRDRSMYPHALDLYFKALAILEEVYMVGLKGVVLRNIGVTYFLAGDIERSENYILKSLEITEKVDLKRFSRDNYKSLSAIYQQWNDHEKAFYYLQRYTELNQQIYNDQLINSVGYFSEKFSDAQQKEQTFRFRLERNMLILAIVILVLIFLAAYFALTYRRFKEKRAHVESLRNTLTEKERTEKALRQSEENYQTLIKTLNEGLVVLDMEHRIEFLNLKACKVFGINDKNDLLGKNFENFLLTPEDEKMFRDKMELQKMGISDHYELKMRNVAGDVMWVNLSSAPILDENLKARGNVTLITDVTERKKSEQTYGELTSNLNQKIKQLNCLYDISDISGVPGITFEEIIEKSLEIIPVGLKYSHDIGVQIMFDDRVYSSPNYKETPWSYVVPIKVQKKKLGHIKVTYLEEKPRINKDPFHFNEKILLKNISEKFGQIVESRNLDQIVNENQQRLEEIQRIARIGNWEKDLITSKCTFSDNFFELLDISVEKRKFFDIDKFLEMIHPEDRIAFAFYEKQEGKEGENISENIFFRVITHEGTIKYLYSGKKYTPVRDICTAQKITFIIQDITEQRIDHEMQFSLGEADSPDKNNVLVVSEIAGKTKDLFAVLSRHKSLALDVKLSKQIPKQLNAHQGKVFQIISGLVSVAVNKSDSGQILLNIHYDIEEQKPGKLVIRISYNGAAFENETLELLVKIAQTFKNKDLVSADSTLLSLSIAYKLSYLLGGQLEISSGKGNENIIEFTLPAEECSGSQGMRKTLTSESSSERADYNDLFKGVKLLCFDQRSLKRRELQSWISEVNGQISFVKSIAELDSIDDPVESFDIILLDIPRQLSEGLNRLNKINKKFSRFIPVIGIGSKISEKDKNTYYGAGISGFINKPLSSGELYGKLAEGLDSLQIQSITNLKSYRV